LTVNVRVLRFDPGNHAARLLIGFGAGRAVLSYVARVTDRSGTVIAQFEGGGSYYGMEIPDHIFDTFRKTDTDIRMHMIREAALEAGRFLRTHEALREH
jgi:hypothetical protein